MKWHVYKKDDPNTWPQIDCPMIVYYDDKIMSCVYFWNNDKHCFFDDKNIGEWGFEECYYAYIGYVPNGYKTCYPIRCTKENCWCKDGYDDNGYCLDYDGDYSCGYKKIVPEYTVEEKRIWKEFE